MLFIIELAVPIIMLKDIITINGKEHMTENIMIVLVMTMAPALIVTKLAQGNLFNAKFISSMLYESYHSNENAECPNVSVDSRFHWISTSEVSTVKYNKEAGTYIFGKDEC